VCFLEERHHIADVLNNVATDNAVEDTVTEGPWVLADIGEHIGLRGGPDIHANRSVCLGLTTTHV
jgi:hypothetical protein